MGEMSDGFYWLKINGDWVPAERDSGIGWWMIVGSEIPIWFDEMDGKDYQVGPKLEPPEGLSNEG